MKNNIKVNSVAIIIILSIIGTGLGVYIGNERNEALGIIICFVSVFLLPICGMVNNLIKCFKN